MQTILIPVHIIKTSIR